MKDDRNMKDAEVINWLASSVRTLLKRVGELETKYKVTISVYDAVVWPKAEDVVQEVPVPKQVQIPPTQNVQKTEEMIQKVPVQKKVQVPLIQKVLKVKGSD